MSRSLRHHNMRQQVQIANRALVQQVRAMSGADGPAVRKSAAVLTKEMRRQLSVAAPGRRTSIRSRRTQGGEPSAPGQAPRMQSGRLRRSIRHKVVDGIRRAGTGDYYGRFLEFGVISAGAAPRPSKNNPRKMTKARKPLVIQARPWARPALDVARKDMVDVAVKEYADPFKSSLSTVLGGDD